MPHALWQLQGQRRAIFVDEKDPHEADKTEHRFDGFEQITPGTLSDHEYDEAVGDLVAYLQWMGEPAQGTRIRIGVGVLIFLGLLIVFTWRLNAAFWKNVTSSRCRRLGRHVARRAGRRGPLAFCFHR